MKPKNEKQTKRTEQLSGFTMPMAVMDMFPVAFFSVTVAVLSGRFESIIFMAGAALVIFAGALKALWKLLLASSGKDVQILNRQMRYTMPAGFVLMTLALIADRDRWSLRGVLDHIFSFPSIVFFIFAAAGIACMVYCARHFDGRDAKANWIEQTINALAQFFFMMGILSIR